MWVARRQPSCAVMHNGVATPRGLHASALVHTIKKKETS
jgi:hypothetical protein